MNDYQSLNWTQRVRNLIGNDLSSLPSFLEISSTLKVNPKRLRRLLNEEGLTYSELKLQATPGHSHLSFIPTRHLSGRDRL